MAQKFTVPITVKQLTSAGSDAITVYVDADTYARLKVEAGGRLVWGSGSGTGDVTLYRESADILKTDDSFKVGGLLTVTASSGDEGGEINLAKPATNSSISGNVAIDIYQNKIRIFETGGSNRGAYIDLTAANTGVGSDLLTGTGGGGATTLDGLTDVAITSPEKYQTVVYDGSGWINEFPTTVSLVNNAESTTLQVGEVVYLFGGTGNHASVKRADNDFDTTSAKTVGMVSTAIPAGGNGPVVTRGYVTGMDLSSGYTAGQTLYLSSTAGQFTTTKPYAPNHLVYVGVVVRATNNGIIYVATQNGYELDEIHDVDLITNAPASGDFLKYNGTLWVNDAINLGTDTVGNYMSDVSAGTGITVTHTPGEGSTATITNAGVTSVNGSTGAITGVVTTADTGTVTSTMIANNTIVNADINTAAAIDLTKLSTTGASSGYVISYNGSAWAASQLSNNSYNLDGGVASSTYGGITSLNGGTA